MFCLIAHFLHGQFKQKCKEVFATLDTSGDGIVDEGELREGLKALDVSDPFLDDELLEALRVNGGISPEEFQFIVRVQSGCAGLENSQGQRPWAKLKVVDYSTERKILWWCQGDNLDGESRRNFLFRSALKPERERLAGKPLLTRWVNVEGRDALLVRELALRYGLANISVG